MMEICRACMSCDNVMCPLDEQFIQNYNLLTNLNVTVRDGLSQSLCKNCMETVLSFIKFKEKCTQSEATLRKSFLEEIKAEENLKEEVQDTQEEFIDDEITLEYEGPDTNYSDLNNSYIKLEGPEDDNCNKRSKRVRNVSKKFEVRHVSKVKKKEKNVNSVVLSCGICPDIFTDKPNLSVHLEKHRNEKKCVKCEESFLDFPQMLVHRFLHVPEKQRRCLVCNKKFQSLVNFEYHYRKYHEVGEVNLCCRECGQSFAKPKSLVSHMNRHHSGNIFVCDICKKQFKTKKNLEFHLNVHSDEKKYKCDICDFTARFSTNIYAHKLAKHLVKYKCEQCKKTFKLQENLDKHSCHFARRICSICGVLVQAQNIGRHTRQHSNQGRFKCDRCPAVYSSRYGLKEHLDKHDGNKRQQCKFCMRKFYSSSVLYKHLRVHTGVRPYVCHICQRGFTGSHNLKVHMKVHGLHVIKKKNSVPETDLKLLKQEANMQTKDAIKKV